MCPRPEGMTKEDWRAYQDRRGGRTVIMGEHMHAVARERGVSLSEAWNVTEAAIMDGTLNLEDGLEEATERWVTARRERYGY